MNVGEDTEKIQPGDCGMYRRTCACQRRGGFTLIEVIMGASIMAVVSAALLGAFLGQSYINAHARNMMAAMNDANRVMEEIRRENTAPNCSTGIPSIAPPVPYNSWNEWLNNQGKSIHQPNQDWLESVAVTCQDGSVELCVPDANITCTDGTTHVTCPRQTVPPTDPVTCPDQKQYAPIPPYCGTLAVAPNPAQVGVNEWAKQKNINTTFRSLRVTVAIGWVQAGSKVGGGMVSGGEFKYIPGHTTPAGFKQPEITTPAQLTVGPETDANHDGVIESPAMLATLVTCR